jgi:hypothetical protein
LFSLHRISVGILFSFLISPVSGSNPFAFRGAAAERGSALHCLMKKSFFSSFSNQALLPFNSSFSAAVNYENRFGIAELGTCTAAAIVPTGKTSEGIIFSESGYTEFRRIMTGLSCGMFLGKNIAAGIQADYFREVAPLRYDNTGFITFEAGALFRISENLFTAVHLFNPLPGTLRRPELPSEITVGAGIDLGSKLFAGFETELSTGQKLIIRTGFDYEAAGNFAIRGGFSTENNSFSLGFSYRTGPVKLETGFSTHDKLGVTSDLSLIFIMGKK